MSQRRKPRTAGQPKSKILLRPNELEGWTSQGPPRHAPQTCSIAQKPRATKSKKPSKKESSDHIPRPLNSFMLFRLDFLQKHSDKDSHHTQLSKYAGSVWHALPEAEKEWWRNQAVETKRQHAKKYPNYKYQPRRSNARPRMQSTPERQIENGSGIFHSSVENSPTSSPAGPPMNDTDNYATLEVSVPANALPTAPVHSRFIQRKQSLRLSNWDDSVLYPQDSSSSSGFLGPYPGSIPPQSNFQSQGWNLDVLQRRSSSAPGPLPVNANSYPNPVYAYDNQLPSRGLSYSGIRPGFNFQNMGSFMESSSTQRDMAPLPQILVTGPPHELFGDHQIPYPVNNTTSPAMFVSPIQEMPSIPYSNTDDNIGLLNWTYPYPQSPEIVYSASSQSPSVSDLPPSFEPFMANPGDLFNQLESAKFDVSRQNLNTKMVSADKGCLDSNFVMNLDPRLLDLSTTPPGDAFTDFCYTQDDNGAEFDSTWDLFDTAK